MKKSISVLTIFVLFFISSPFTEAHSGRTDSSGGHNCSQKSISKGLCSGYHYHNGGSSSTKSSSSSTKSSSSSSSSSNYIKSSYAPEPLLTTVDVYIDNNWKRYNPSAYMKNGTTLVPMRAIFEDLGATVEYNSSTKTITANKGSEKITLTVGNKTAYVNTDGVNSSISLSHSAESYKNSTMVPLRFIGEALGATVEWNSTSLIVDITTN